MPYPRETQTEPISAVDCFDGKPKTSKNNEMPATISTRSKQGQT
jgi:hypothetical protein